MLLNGHAVFLLLILGLGSVSLFTSFIIRPVEAGSAAINNATVLVQQNSLSLNPGAQLYIYGLVTGGGFPTGNFANGSYASVSNADGLLVAALAATSSSANSFTTQTAYYDIGGAAVSGFSQYASSYGSNSSPGATGASDTFTVSTSGSLVVVFGLGGGEQCLTLSGILGLTTDATDNGAAGLPPVITIAHAYLDPGTYTATEQTQQCAAGQDANHAADLIGVFVFTSVSATTTEPTTTGPTTTTVSSSTIFSSITSSSTSSTPGPVITSVSSISPASQQTIYIYGSGFGSTPPQTVPVGDGSVDTYACNVNTPSLAIWGNGGGSHNWAAGRETCSNFDAIGVYLQSWSDTQIILGGFGSALSTSGSGTWNIGAGDPLVVNVWGPNGSGPAQYSMTVSAPFSYTVTFSQSGLVSGTSWSVTFNGQTQSSSSNSITFPNVSNGQYSWSLTPPTGYASSQTSGTITVNGANANQQIQFTAVTASWDFGLDHSSSITLSQGASGSNIITATLVAGSGQPVSLSCNTIGPSLPTGVSCSFNPPSVTPATPGATSTLVVSTTLATPAGSYAINVFGSGGGQTRETVFTLTVNPASSSFDFRLACAGINACGITVNQGSSGSNLITASILSGAAQQVSLSCISGLPTGASCSFNPPSSTPTFTSVLTISTTTSTPTGSFAITVTAMGGGVAHSTSFTLTVNAASTPSYTVMFSEQGLPTTNQYLVWSVTFNGQVESSNSPGNTITAVTFTEVAPGESYLFDVSPPEQYTAVPLAGSVTVNSSTCTTNVNGNPTACIVIITFTSPLAIRIGEGGALIGAAML